VSKEERCRLGKGLVAPYELRARVLPGLLLAVPIMVTSLSCSGELVELGKAALATGVTGTAAMLVLGAMACSFGRRAEGSLWTRWGGPPSRLLLMPDDDTFSKDMKETLHHAIEERTCMPFPSVEDFERDADESVRRVDDLFLQVRGALRREAPDGLWAIHNVDYGFARNLYGSLVPLVAIGAVAAIGCVVWAHVLTARLAYLGALINAGISVGALLARAPLEQHVRYRAFRYAESAWEAFLNLHKRNVTNGAAVREHL